MVIPINFRCITQRSVLAILATATGVGLTSDSAAQNRMPSAPISGPVPDFDFLDVPLAEGERIISTSTEDGGVIEYEGGNYRMIDSSAVPTAASKHAAGGHVTGGHVAGGHAATPSFSGGFAPSGHCASGNCGSGTCGTCGKGRGLLGHSLHGGYPGPGGGLVAHGRGGTDLGGHPRLGAGGNVCGPTCNPYHYAAADVLYMSNDNLQNYVGIAPFVVSDYDYEFGIRATLGSVPDCQNGYEATFVGPFRWTTDRTIDPGDIPGPLTSSLVVNLPLFPGDNLTSFIDSDFQTQRFEAEMYSFELNRTLIGWDVIKLLYGARYIQYDEDFLYTAVGGGPVGDGLLRSDTENRMIGGQVGIEMTYPITCRLWSDMRARAGAYANFAENEFRYGNDDSLLLSNGDDAVELAGMFEIGGGVRYYVTNNFHLRAGGEVWYLTQVASAVDQFRRRITPRTGRQTEVSDDVFMFGVSAGAEWKF